MTLTIITLVIVFIGASLGASIASFACVVVERTRRGEPLSGRSHCACGRELQWWENVPIVGWLRTRGLTKCCNVALPVHYLVWEITLFVVFGVLTWVGLTFLL